MTGEIGQKIVKPIFKSRKYNFVSLIGYNNINSIGDLL